MDVSRPRERIVSILNDNDSPSFAIRRAQSPVSKAKEQSHHHQHSFSYSKLERPQLYRFSEYAKQPSPASEPSTPPLLRHDSSSSSTSSAMENSPSPITPEYPYLDAQNNVISLYDALVQQNQTYLPSPTTITPLIEQGMMIAPVMTDPTMPYAQKLAPQFHSMPATIPTSAPTTTQPLAPAAPDVQQAQMQSQAQTASAPQQQQQQPAPKKNKYPCPYAQSHGCPATFTTSGHAARHGKKHTGEKSVHCPTCGKAFTRKDNMKQHERTHKNSSSASNTSDDSRKSKAAVTKAAVAERAHKRAASEAQSTSSISRKDSGQHQSPLSEVTSAGDAIQPTLATSISDPVSMESSEPPPMVFSEDGTTGPTVIAPAPQTHPEISAYPPLDEETLGQINQRPMPSFPRTFSDLDTLAMAATYDPYNIQNGQL